jgi:hypothetical protein
LEAEAGATAFSAALAFPADARAAGAAGAFTGAAATLLATAVVATLSALTDFAAGGEAFPAALAAGLPVAEAVLRPAVGFTEPEADEDDSFLRTQTSYWLS